MSFNKISVLVPTRKRLDYLERMLNSYNDTIVDKSQVELIFRCDNDDQSSIDYIKNAGYQLMIGERKDGYKSLPTFFNEMLTIANGDLFVCGNDDMLFKTSDWPKLIIDEANKYKDGIFNIGVSTGLNDDKFPFSIVSEVLVKAMGLINDPRLLFSDIFLLDVAKYFNRAVTLNNVIFFHDWAGHGDDQTRREANQHEFGEVFADNQGNWSDYYRLKHDVVVYETIKKILYYLNKNTDEEFLTKNDGTVEIITNDVTKSLGFPKHSFPTHWLKGPSDCTIHYNKSEIDKLLHVIKINNIANKKILLTSINNGMPTVFWGNIFEKVITIASLENKKPFISDNKYLMCYGSVGNTKFMYEIIEKVKDVNALLIDAERYSEIISPYYLFKKIMTKPGIIIFINSLNISPVKQFITGLRNGTIDGICHEIFDIESENGFSLSYELIK